jgi:hypothetical protein
MMAFSAAEASARVPDEPRSSAVVPPPEPTYNFPDYDSVYRPTHTQAATDNPSDGNATGALQLGASALGGAGLALSGLWLYRRRQQPAA